MQFDAACGDYGIFYLPMFLAFHSNLPDIHQGTVRSGWKIFGWCVSLIQMSPNNTHKGISFLLIEFLSQPLQTWISFCAGKLHTLVTVMVPQIAEYTNTGSALV